MKMTPGVFEPVWNSGLAGERRRVAGPSLGAAAPEANVPAGRLGLHQAR